MISVLYIDDQEELLNQSVGRDITKRKIVEQNLAQSEELYRTVFESTCTSMMIPEIIYHIRHEKNDKMSLKNRI